ncbi:DNA-formamidopyrimidine glycosylase [Patescibacteria group bacterium]|nr:DNA-formamidopyrimidine glycosylase [Patescibacteria group bacterium]
MPEGPEVQSIVTDLHNLIVGRRILDLVTYDYTRRLFGEIDVDCLRDKTAGSKIVGVTRRGKNIILQLSSDVYLAIHLRMTGQMFLRSDVPKYCRLTIKLDGGEDLHLADVRTFATCEVWDAKDFETFEAQKKIGVDALSPSFSLRDLKTVLQSKRLLPAVLLDQTKISGLGNIYVNECLFESGIHPLRKANNLSCDEIKKLHQVIVKILKKAIENRGTTFSDYRLPGGEIGGFQKYLKVFRRDGEPCVKCKQSIKRKKSGGRSVFYCSNCQI